jgi:hypothetical protein
MLEIAESNGETSNNSARLAAAALIISIARLAVAALVVLIVAIPLKFTALAIPVIATPLKRSACKAASRKGSNNWTNCIKDALSELVNLLAKKF